MVDFIRKKFSVNYFNDYKNPEFYKNVDLV